MTVEDTISVFSSNNVEGSLSLLNTDTIILVFPSSH